MEPHDLTHLKEVRTTLVERLSQLQASYDASELSAHDIICNSAYAMQLAFDALMGEVFA